jgi:hypothetical protein
MGEKKGGKPQEGSHRKRGPKKEEYLVDKRGQGEKAHVAAPETILRGDTR